MKVLTFLLIFTIVSGPLLASRVTATQGKVPERIISLGPLITDMIYLIGAQDKLAGVTSYCKIPAGNKHKDIIGTVMQMNVEKIVHLQPDLVIANALTRQKQILLLRKQGITVMEIATPQTFDQICSNFLRLGNIVGMEQQAKEITKQAQETVAAIYEQARDLKKRSVFIQIGLKPLKTSSKETFIHEYIELAGGYNIARDAKEGVYSREKVLRQDPDVILIATMGSSKKAGMQEKKSWEKFSYLKAVKNNEIHVLDPDIVCSPTPETFANGLGDFFRLIHPDATKETVHGEL